jgi:hypothetical protein
MKKKTEAIWIAVLGLLPCMVLFGIYGFIGWCLAAYVYYLMSHEGMVDTANKEVKRDEKRNASTNVNNQKLQLNLSIARYNQYEKYTIEEMKYVNEHPYHFKRYSTKNDFSYNNWLDIRTLHRYVYASKAERGSLEESFYCDECHKQIKFIEPFDRGMYVSGEWYCPHCKKMTSVKRVDKYTEFLN